MTSNDIESHFCCIIKYWYSITLLKYICLYYGKIYILLIVHLSSKQGNYNLNKYNYRINHYYASEILWWISVANYRF